mmetsp:Transcript_21750/g.44040  ORF Transcript_21750/g.44040 Transcript_21750/m.44040 type:complete len:255 (-) Transcript_21750:18-782(-)
MHVAAIVQRLYSAEQHAPEDAGDAPPLLQLLGPDAGEEVLQGQAEHVHDQEGLVLMPSAAQQHRDPSTSIRHLFGHLFENGHLITAGRPLQSDLLSLKSVLCLVDARAHEAGTYGADHVVLPHPRPTGLLLGRRLLHVLHQRLGRAHLLPQRHLEHAEDRSGTCHPHHRGRLRHGSVVGQRLLLGAVARQLLGVEDLLAQVALGDELLPGGHGARIRRDLQLRVPLIPNDDLQLAHLARTAQELDIGTLGMATA